MSFGARLPPPPPPPPPPPAVAAAAAPYRAPPPGFIPGGDVPTGPPVTVFVGNITERAQDAMIRHLLTTCGPVLSWKRVQGATGKLQAFGFCEYGNPDAGLRAIRILHDWAIADKKLVVKVDAKTKEILDEYKVQRRRRVLMGAPPAEGSKEGGETQDEEYMDEGMKREDEMTKDRINAILQDHSKEMNSFIPKDSKDDRPKEKFIVQTGPKESLDDVEMEDGKRDIIHREIDKFRETMKIREAEKEEEKKKREEEQRNNNSVSRHRSLERRRDRSREKSSSRRSVRKSVTRSRSRSFSPRRRDRGDSRSSRRSRRPTRSRSRSRSRRRERSTPTRKSQQEMWKEREIEEEAKERKRAERKTREKEANYQERLRKWESREAKMSKDFDKERIREAKRLEDIEREAKRLKEFLEDYDDERDDEKYYRGRELERRLAEREREAAKDADDRAKEKEEIEDLKNQIVDEGYKGGDQNVELKRRIEERERRHNGGNNVIPPIVHIDDEPVIIPAPPDQQADMDNIADDGCSSPGVSPPSALIEEPTAQPPLIPEVQRVSTSAAVIPPIQIAPPIQASFQPVPLPKQSLISTSINSDNTPMEPGQKKRLDVRDVFNQDDDDVSSAHKKNRKGLPPISKKEDSQPPQQQQAKASSEDKRKHIKSLIEKIPTDRAALFAYKVDWDMVDNQLMEKRIRPWVNKKIAEYIGEPEPTLTDFICSKVLAGSSPKAVLEDVQMVLDEEAEVFVVKMWRLLIYEIENKKYKASTAAGGER